MKKTTPHIPYDMYESASDVQIVLPLGGVQKDSLHSTYTEYKILITGTRINPMTGGENAIEMQCHWGDFSVIIDLPPYIYREQITSRLTKENILLVRIPKRLDPDEIALDIVID